MCYDSLNAWWQRHSCKKQGHGFVLRKEKKREREKQGENNNLICHSCYPRWWIQFTNGRKVPSVKRSDIAPALFSDCFPKKSASCLLVLAWTSLQMSSTSFSHTDAQQHIKVPCPLTIQDMTLKLAQAFKGLFRLPLNKSHTRWNPTKSSGQKGYKEVLLFLSTFWKCLLNEEQNCFAKILQAMQISSCHLNASHPTARKTSIIRLSPQSPSLDRGNHQHTHCIISVSAPKSQ